MKTRVIRFLGIDFVAVPQPTGSYRCKGCALDTDGSDFYFDCDAVNPTCGTDKTIYVINEESLARRVAERLTNKET